MEVSIYSQKFTRILLLLCWLGIFIPGNFPAAELYRRLSPTSWLSFLGSKNNRTGSAVFLGDLNGDGRAEMGYADSAVGFLDINVMSEGGWAVNYNLSKVGVEL